MWSRKIKDRRGTTLFLSCSEYPVQETHVLKRVGKVGLGSFLDFKPYDKTLLERNPILTLS